MNAMHEPLLVPAAPLEAHQVRTVSRMWGLGSSPVRPGAATEFPGVPEDVRVYMSPLSSCSLLPSQPTRQKLHLHFCEDANSVPETCTAVTPTSGWGPFPQKSQTMDFPGGPLVETPCSQCRELGFDP